MATRSRPSRPAAKPAKPVRPAGRTRPAPTRRGQPAAAKDPQAIAPFAGFADAEGTFFKQLDRHQDRAWFAAHKADYEDGWAGPMLSLLHAVRARIDDDYPYHELSAPKVFRIQRDVRFARDKTPYKTNVAGIVLARGRGADPVTEVPAALYLHVGLECVVAAGQYMMAAPALARFRAAVVDDERGAEVARLVEALRARRLTVRSVEELQKVPRGFDPDHPRAELLRWKGMLVSPPALPRRLLPSPKLVDWIADFARQAAPLTAWLATNTTG
jgi:uncharacterized protein (TIGR02453 family)